MADYSKQTWVDDDGSGGTGTVFTAARMNNIEEGIRVAGKQAVLVPAGSAGTPTDSNSVVWRRASDGALVAYQQVVESGVTPNRGISATDRVVAEGTGTGLVFRGIEAVHKNTANDTDIGARVTVLGQKGNRRTVRAAADSDAGASQNVLIIDDLAQSDFLRNPSNPQDKTGTWGGLGWGASRQPNTLRSTLVTVSFVAVAGTQASIYVGAASGPTTGRVIAGGGGQTAAWVPATIIVPPGWYYRFVADTGAPAFGSIIEWTL